MPFDFNQFLTLATALAANPDEASQRTAISRAYYTVFHSARGRIELTVGTWEDRKNPARIGRHKDLSSHEWCWKQFRETNDTACRQIAAEGDRMKTRRTKADYKPADYGNINAEVQRQLVAAAQLQADLAALNALYPAPLP